MLQTKGLQSDLCETQRQFQSIVEQEKEKTIDRSFKKENSFDAAKGKDKNSCQVTYEEILELIKKFANLYDKDGMEILRILRELPEFRGSTELQYKTIMSVIVLSYRSVQENVERRRRMIFEILGDQPSENEESENLDNAFYRYMSRKAMDEHGINGTTKEVILQIWNSLYNLPSLRTCTLFNKFILDCVRTIWDLVTGMNGKPPSALRSHFGDHGEVNKDEWKLDNNNPELFTGCILNMKADSLMPVNINDTMFSPIPKASRFSNICGQPSSTKGLGHVCTRLL
ncbi:unnamed protein product [Onchocerca ochengi]|uniref:Mitochondria-eating protein n=1 Tax=Onchocerca ochengi TaxID=42157 RepID=A0A182E0L6_ONCOC|nr:unnamed protein product [Onchocerca ochengi]